MSKFIKIIVGVVVLSVSLVLLTFSYYVFQLTAPSSDDKMVNVEIPKGATGSSIATILKDNGLIRDELVFRAYLKVHKVNNISYGIYELNKAMGVKTIAEIIGGGNPKYAGIKILFKEGKNMWSIAKTIADKTNNKESDVYALLADDSYIDSLISQYWFLSDSIKDSNIYYPLEGYLAPNTYQFENKSVSVKDIFKSMLDQTDKVLTPYKDKFKDYTVHQYLTLASVVEDEGKTFDDRKNIAGVFYNRLAAGDKLGSDVTTYYAMKLDNFARDLTTAEINTYNPYNTRGPQMNGKLPVGPIGSPSEDAIKAVIEPSSNDYMFFVADKNGKVYFTKTYEEHNAKIAELKEKNLWYQF